MTSLNRHSLLALLGGHAVARAGDSQKDRIKPSEAAIEAVSRTLRSGAWSMFTSAEVETFEREFAEYVGASYSVLVNSCTTAILASLIAADVSQGDYVAVPAYTYVGTCMPIVALGARPVLVDVDLDSQTIALDSLKHAFDKHPIRAVIQAHLFGRSTGAPEIKALCERNGAAYISDCAQLIGDKAITSMLSELGPTCYSFGDSKLLRIGEGGAVATNSAAVAERVRLARHEGEVWLRHGASRLVAEKTAIQDVICGLASVRLGLNFRPLAIAASLGRVVLRELAERLHQTRANAEALTEGLQGLDDLALPEAKERTWWTYPVLIRRNGIKRDVILAALLAEGIPVGVHFPRLLAHQPLIQRLAIFELSELQGAVEFSERHLVLPIYPPLTPAHMNVISTAFRKVLSSDQLRSKKAIQQAQQLLNDWPIDELCDGLFVFLK